MAVLDAILEAKRASLPELRNRALPSPPAARALSFRRAPGAPLRLFAEIKRRSPSAGELSKRLSVGERARSYERAGASLVSVLTDSPFFGGRFEDLQEARAACDLPLLCKDFIIDECQLDLARAFGADFVLLIVRCLDDLQLTQLLGAARDRGLIALVEIASQSELTSALDAGADLIGVNARDLDDLRIDTTRAAGLVAAVPPDRVCAHLSGIGSVESLAPVADGRADAALIGEALMRQDDPEPLLRKLHERAASSAAR